METLTINASSRTYPIYFDNSFDNLYQSIIDIGVAYSSYVIITDSNVGPIYQETIKKALKPFNKDILISTFEAGEQNKKLETIYKFYGDMIEFGADRKTLVIALGGGVCGDMAGFLAATYMRGVDFVQVPTSLLSQVDSSVGGKTGVDFNGYKNIVGAFYQPRFVYINVDVHKTLPAREFHAGMGEVVKHGFIKDNDYHKFLSDNVESVLALDQETLIKMIKWSCKIKKSVVDQDETEQGCRALLNFGHTLGHAIERLKEFKLIHGECVGIGMHGALLLSTYVGTLSKEKADECIALIKAYKMPLQASEIDSENLYNEMFYDKKTTSKRIVFALLNDIGDSYLTSQDIDKELVLKAMKSILL